MFSTFPDPGTCIVHLCIRLQCFVMLVVHLLAEVAGDWIFHLSSLQEPMANNFFFFCVQGWLNMSSRLTFLTNYQTSVIQFNPRNFISFATGISVHHYQCGKTFCVKTGKWLLFFTKKKKKKKIIVTGHPWNGRRH